jgi:hypothetical protein
MVQPMAGSTGVVRVGNAALSLMVGTRLRGLVEAMAVSAVLAFTLVGCGSGSGPADAGGFTGSLRASAQKALNSLQYSPVLDTISTFNTPNAELSTCTVHVLSAAPLVFRLFMAWQPRNLGFASLPISQSAAQVRIRYSWLEATIPTASNSNPTLNVGQIPAALPIQSATRQLELREGPAYVVPFEECELLPTGGLRGFSYGNISNPLTTTTSPYTTTTG